MTANEQLASVGKNIQEKATLIWNVANTLFGAFKPHEYGLVILPMVVIKKDGSRQSFDRNKVLGGLIRACEKRPVPYSALESMANEIEQVLQNKMEREVSSAMIGELVMEKLKDVDEVAYVRFASVYRQFTDVSSFMDELNKLVLEGKARAKEDKPSGE